MRKFTIGATLALSITFVACGQQVEEEEFAAVTQPSFANDHSRESWDSKDEEPIATSLLPVTDSLAIIAKSKLTPGDDCLGDGECKSF